MTPEVDPAAYFERIGDDELLPRPSAKSVWSDEMLGGRHLAALIAWGAERSVDDEAYQATRLTVDMFRPTPMQALRIRSNPIREGHRVRVIDVTIEAGGVVVTRGSVMLLRRGDPPPGSVWAPPEWDVPHPDDVPPSPNSQSIVGDMRPLSPWNGWADARRVWLRNVVPFVEGETLSPFVHASLVADFANPLANSGDRGLGYINADLTLYLARLPVGEWLGCEVIGHVADAGVAVGTVAVYDLTGRIGYSTVSALVDLRLQRSS